MCGFESEGGEKTGMHQRKTAKQISGGRPPCLHQRGAVTATTPHKYLTVIFKLQNTQSPASDKNTYFWNYQRNAKLRPSAPPSLLSLSLRKVGRFHEKCFHEGVGVCVWKKARKCEFMLGQRLDRVLCPYNAHT